MTRSPIAGSSPRRAWSISAVVLVALADSGCARDRREITPTTQGTNFEGVPRGRMIAQPFPGSSLARSRSRPARVESPIDPETAAASHQDSLITPAPGG
ncbi:hypothetical protein P12x_002792 [Tundrisphaera lichenicola]|uniref:hypothetical protein n=1 Tax=Tundrisphaera lichenicola TaxID=2029860 RepID=UPI003EB82604